MLRRRLTIRFTLQMAFAGILLITIAFLILFWMFKQLESIEIKRNFAPFGISRLIEEAVVDEEGLIVNEQLLEMLEQDGGWLQSLDEHGHVLQSFFAPEDVPSQYHPAELIDYWQGTEPFPYSLGLWIQQKDDRLFIMLYGKTNPASQTLQSYIDHSEVIGATINFSPDIEQFLVGKQAWVQIVDQMGTEVAAWQKPEHVRSSYTLSELALRTSYPDRYGTLLQSHYDELSGLTWIVQMPFPNNSSQLALLPGIEAEMQIIVIAIVLFVAAVFLIMFGLAFGYAQMFVKPIFDIVRWIQSLGDERREQNQSRDAPKRKLFFQRKTHLFKEVKDSIQTLDAALHANKNAEKQTQTYREEWIAGVTHDMRTPLSSIQGYAHMLAANQYSWNEQEVRSFAATILEKSQYMDQLIEDLSLTYRLRSGNMPVSLELHNIGLLLQEIVERAVASPAYSEHNITCHIPEQHIFRSIYPPWFERIVSNLIANAILHNPSNTTIVIALQELEHGGWQLDVQDDGNGMNEATMEKLFDRYYRGTNTDETIEGSGLGMAITKELVQAMDGRIEVISEPNKGTMIRLIWYEVKSTR